MSVLAMYDIYHSETFIDKKVSLDVYEEPNCWEITVSIPKEPEKGSN
jgi:hypothetical protein